MHQANLNVCGDLSKIFALHCSQFLQQCRVLGNVKFGQVHGVRATPPHLLSPTIGLKGAPYFTSLFFFPFSFPVFFSLQLFLSSVSSSYDRFVLSHSCDLSPTFLLDNSVYIQIFKALYDKQRVCPQHSIMYLLCYEIFQRKRKAFGSCSSSLA